MQKCKFTQKIQEEFEKQNFSNDESLRKKALTRLIELGLPSTKDKHWHYANLNDFKLENISPSFLPYHIQKEELEKISNELIDISAKYQINFLNNNLIDDLTSSPTNNLTTNNLTTNNLTTSNLTTSNLTTSNLTDTKKNLTKCKSTIPDKCYLENTNNISSTKNLSNNVFASKYLLPNKLDIDSLSYFEALNLALFTSGAYFVIPKNTKISSPIYLNFITNQKNNNSLVNPRNFIIIEPDSEVNLVENYININNSNSFANSSTTILVGEGSKVNYHLLQNSTNERSNNINIIHNNIYLDKGSTLKTIILTTKNPLTHINLNINLTNKNITCINNILSYAKNTDINNLNLKVVHEKPNSKSNTIYKSIANNKAKTSFIGNIEVKEKATKTKADLQSKSLVLSNDALANTEPQLEINCDDVICSHGATCGYLDEKAIYYLRTRGMPLNMAKKMLIDAFLAPILSNVKIKKLYDFYNKLNLSNTNNLEHDIYSINCNKIDPG